MKQQKLKQLINPLALVAMTALLLLAVPLKTAFGKGFGAELSELFFDTYQEAKSYLDGLIAQTYGKEAPFVQEALDEALGVLGLSDPLIAEEQISEGVIAAERVFDLNQPPAVVRAAAVVKEVDRQRLRSHVGSVIGQEGQVAIQTKMDRVEVALQETQELGFLAEDAFSTQEAIKKMARQNVKNAELLGALQTEVINGRIDSQFEAEVLANISQTLDEEQKARFNRDLARVMARLRSASEATLF